MRTVRGPATASDAARPTRRARGSATSKGSASHTRIVVRPATVADLETVVRLRLSLLREHAGHPMYGRLRDDAEVRAGHLFAVQLASATEVVFLAFDRDDAIGILRCVDSPGSPLLLPARYAYVSSTYVVPRARRRGVLRALLAAADVWCAARGLTEMRLHNATGRDDANAAWASLGFDVVEVMRTRRLRAD